MGREGEEGLGWDEREEKWGEGERKNKRPLENPLEAKHNKQKSSASPVSTGRTEKPTGKRKMKPFKAQKQKRMSQASDISTLRVSLPWKYKVYAPDSWATWEVSAQPRTRDRTERRKTLVIVVHNYLK